MVTPDEFYLNEQDCSGESVLWIIFQYTKMYIKCILSMLHTEPWSLAEETWVQNDLTVLSTGWPCRSHCLNKSGITPVHGYEFLKGSVQAMNHLVLAWFLLLVSTELFNRASSLLSSTFASSCFETLRLPSHFAFPLWPSTFQMGLLISVSYAWLVGYVKIALHHHFCDDSK